MNRDAYLNELAVFLEEVKSCIPDITSKGTLSASSKNMMLDLSNDYYELFNNYRSNDYITADESHELDYILDTLSTFQNSMKENDNQAFQKACGDLVQVSAREQMQKEMSAEKSYQGSAYFKGTGKKQVPTTIYGNSPEDIIAALQERNKDHPEEQQLKTCYIRKLNQNTNKYENPVKYDIASGIDITPIYLSLPYMSKEKYVSVVKGLREKGAKYNPEKKAFFITRQNDLNLFSDYLPIIDTQSPSDQDKHPSTHLKADSRRFSDCIDKKSVLEKLNENKAKLEPQHQLENSEKADITCAR